MENCVSLFTRKEWVHLFRSTALHLACVLTNTCHWFLLWARLQ